MSTAADDVDREAREELTRFFSLALDLLCVADTEGTFRHLKGTWEKTLGYPAAELEGTRLVDLVHPEDVALTRTAIGDLSTGPAARSFVNRCRTREGAYRWIEWRASPYDGKLIYAIARDITERRRFGQAVLEQKEVLETVLANMAQAMLIADADMRVVACNQKFEPLFGFNPGEMRAGESVETLVRLWATRTSTDAAQLEKVLGALRKVEPFVSEYRQRVGDGPETWIQLFHSPLPEGGFVRTYTDITERKRAETRIRHLNRVYALLTEINQAILRVREPQALFTDACRIAVEKGGFRMAWVGLLELGANRVLPVAHAGVTDGYLEKLELVPGGGPRGLGPAAGALREGGRAVFNDIEHDPPMAPWRDEALARGYRASATFPLAVGGEILGVFALYASEPGFFDEEELRLLDEMAADLSYAIQVARLEDVRARLATAIEQVPVSVVVTDTEGRIEYVNPAFTWITGYASEEALGRNPRLLKSGKQGPETYQQLWAAISAGKNWHGELLNRRKDGSFYTQELTIGPVRDATGRVAHFVAIGQDVTDRKKDEQALRLARFSLDQAADMILWVNREGQHVYANGTALRLLGYSREELLRLSLWNVAGGQSPAAWPATWEAGRKAGSVALEDTARRKDGSTLPVEVVVNHLAFGDTELLCAVMRDITDRKRAEYALRESERALRENEQRLSVALSAIDMAVFSQNKDLVYTWMFRPQLGYSTAMVVGRTDAELLPLEAARQTIEVKRRALETGAAARGEVSIAFGDRTLYYDVVVEPLRDADGQVVGITGASLDITARKEAQEAILKEKALSEAMLNSIPGIFYLFDHEGRFLRWNNSLETVSGYSAREIAARHPLDFFGGQDRTVIEEAIGRVFETGKAEVEAALVSKDGRRTPHYFVGVRVAVDGVPCCIGTGFDVTARKQVEAQLQQSQKIEAIGRLAGGVAHDFNNIIAVITGYGEMAQDQLGPGHPVRGRVDEMLKAANRAADLTQQLLAFSRKQVTQPKVLDLNRIVADTRKMLGRLIGEDVDVVIHTADGLGAVKADPGQLAQIILNLAVNARDAMPKGGSLTVETANVDLDEDYAVAHPHAVAGRYVLLAVSDTGVGMDEETKSRIFEPFFTTKRQGEGTGLGLATVYGIVKQSDGFIQVYSEPGRGTTFKVYLPRVLQETPPGWESPAMAEVPRGTETILVAEDTVELREVIRVALEDRGYNVLLASNGEEALKVAREHMGPIPLLLTDVVMPKLGGGDLGKQVFALRPGIRVLYMTGYTDGAISQHGVLKEGIRLLQKPFTGRKLAHAVREALDTPGAEPRGSGGAWVLLVEDDLQVRRLTAFTLEGAGYRVDCVGTVAAASEALGSGHEYIAVLCDLTLPDGSGEDVVRQVREMRGELSDRVIVLTGGAIEVVRERLLAAGVTEVLEKPVPRDVLIRHLADVASRQPGAGNLGPASDGASSTKR